MKLTVNTHVHVYMYIFLLCSIDLLIGNVMKGKCKYSQSSVQLAWRIDYIYFVNHYYATESIVTFPNFFPLLLSNVGSGLLNFILCAFTTPLTFRAFL